MHKPRETDPVTYLGYQIYWQPKSIPSSAHDWNWEAIDYDGPEDGRAGTGASIEDCIEQIQDLEDERFEAAQYDLLENK